MRRAALPLIAGLAVVAVAGIFIWNLSRSPASADPSAADPSSRAGVQPADPDKCVPTDPAPPASPKLDAETAAALARFKDTKVPLEKRRAEIRELAAKGDADAVKLLMALGNEKAYLNWAAVEALGSVRSAEQKGPISAYLKGKLTDGDSRVLCAAIRAYGRLSAEEAVAALAAVIRANRRRDDGHEDMVCNAAVEVLSGLATPRATGILSEELGRSEQKGWDLEYGSLLVKALSRIGTEEARARITAYADRLSKRVPADPVARAYWQKKIAEARAAARG
jgi:HEAT repeat protein